MEMTSLVDYLEESCNTIDEEIQYVGVQMSNTIFVSLPNASYYTLGLSSVGDDYSGKEANDCDDDVENNFEGGEGIRHQCFFKILQSQHPSPLRRLLPVLIRSFGMPKILKPSQVQDKKTMKSSLCWKKSSSNSKIFIVRPLRKESANKLQSKVPVLPTEQDMETYLLLHAFSQIFKSQ
ncbi:hypothetical protein HOLleu_25182 [Holothuria leucospilota]|uniref:Uncharacterized protein n=1 Tax=Holothuria leucospilota TaxID=206669 RepID=A0A9Q1BRP2_HOLLE|nr:hypothetical protein HOLleu_25182 [Holothuria leucospilota]